MKFGFKHYVKTALFLLPHVLLYVLLDGTQDDSEEVGYRVSLDVRNVLMVAIKYRKIPKISPFT